MDSMETTEVKIPVKKVTKKKPIYTSLTAWLFVAVVVFAGLYFAKSKEVALMQNPMAQSGYSEEELKQVTDEMKKSVRTSDEDEVKILGIVDNPDTLKEQQAFYKDIEKGDYVFVFTGTSRALIWRPASKQVVNFGVFEVKNDTPVPAPTETKAPAKAE